jgi:hypothetical protein
MRRVTSSNSGGSHDDRRAHQADATPIGKEAKLCVCRWIETAISGYGPLSTDGASGESHNAVECCAHLIPGCFEPLDVIVISPKMEVPRADQLLVTRHGLEVAVKSAANEKSNARRARNRERFEFWAAIGWRLKRAHTKALQLSERAPRMMFNPHCLQTRSSICRVVRHSAPGSLPDGQGSWLSRQHASRHADSEL